MRFADILTTASAAAHYLGDADVVAQHVLYGIALLTREMVLEDLGRAVSPLVRRTPPGTSGAVEQPVRELAQRWFAALGSDADARVSSVQLAKMRVELRQLVSGRGESGVPPD